MITITCTLVVSAVLCMIFKATRGIGVLCVAVLCLLYPIPILVLVLVGIGINLYSRRRIL